ncbi:MAG: glutamine-hydrolyzing carbamoyl-phosphate synthase small subunit [Myxococcales bacterium]|nr:glutamine-hydrolyzing carbamoyl-phosphate synthase small subunit [Myxococcales bacterium]MCB9642117.1 glutamine-hydrolyzing carbamoyl-phosphate synthase small subunit [Myxococcales bacterium]
MAQVKKVARLALEDGSIWKGWGFGADGTQEGEVVFNTSLTGYQEILTDPSYAGQIVLMTTPQIGNTGINEEDDEASRTHLEGFVVRELSPSTSNWRASSDLSEWLKKRGVIGISGVDTRAITRRLREHGSLRGVLSTEEQLSDEELIARTRQCSGTEGQDLVSQVTCKEPYAWEEPTDHSWEFSRFFRSQEWDHRYEREPLHVVVMDFGVKRNILRRIASWNCRVTVVPAQASAEDILALKPDGILLSNGPGDPAAVTYAIETIRDLLGKVPMLGICMGHQLISLAMGARSYKLKFGHHGGNHPVKYLPEGRIEISSQNHNYAIDSSTLPKETELLYINLNDQSCAGIRDVSRGVMGIQYHPEAAPGPHDGDPLFRQFVQMMLRHKNGDAGDSGTSAGTSSQAHA